MSKPCPRCNRPIPADAPRGICPYCVLEQALEGTSDEAKHLPVEAQRDLIFALLAVQLGCATAEQFIAIGVEWISQPELDLSTRLINECGIKPDKVSLIDELTDAAIKHHGGDVRQTLDGLSIDHTLDELFSMSGLAEASDGETKIGLPIALNDEISSARALSEDPGRYTHKSEYSRGGMGRILLVHDQYLSRDIALKELLPDRLRPSSHPSDSSTPFSRTASMIARFLREARITGQLEHPNIVPVYELGKRDSGTFYYTMKLIRGETLATALKKSTSLKQRMRLIPNFVDLVQAMAYAHSRQVVHRDIKPGNVMLGPFGETVVIDWGLAKIIGESDDVEDDMTSTLAALREHQTIDEFETREGAKLGTPAYMSPEQARGQIATVDARSDVFSLGAMLYELLTGKPPYDGLPLAELLDSIASKPVPPPDPKATEASPELCAICRKALSFAREDRYVDAGAMLADLQSFVSGAMVGAHQYNLREVLGRFYARNKDAVRVSIVAALVLLMVATYSYIRVFQERDAAILARDEAERSSYAHATKLAQTILDGGNHEGARELLVDQPEALRGWEWGYLWNRASPAGIEIEDVSVGEWFSDSQRIVVAGRNRRVRIVDAATGDEILGFDTSLNRTNDISLSPQESLVAQCGGIIPRIHIFSVDTGEEVSVCVGHQEPAVESFFVPDGDRLISRSVDGTCKIWDVATGDELFTIEQNESTAWASESVSPDGSTLYGYFRSNTEEPDSENYTLWAFDFESTQLTLGPPGKLLDLDFEQDLAFAEVGSNVHVYSLPAFEQIMEFESHQGRLMRGMYEEQRNVFYSFSDAQELTSWNAETGDMIWNRRIEKNPRKIQTLQNAHLALMDSSIDYDLEVWDLEQGFPFSIVSSATSLISDLKVSPDNSRVFVSRFNQMGTFLPMEECLAYRSFRVHDYIGWAKTFSNRANRAIVNSESMSIVIDTDSLVPQFGLYSGVRTNGVISNDGTRVAFKVGETGIGIVDIDDRELIGLYGGHTSKIVDLAWCNQLDEIISVDWGGEIHRWNTNNFTQIEATFVSNRAPSKVLVGPLSEKVVVGTMEGDAYYWSNSLNEEPLRVDTAGYLQSSQFYSDGSQVVFGTSEGRIQVVETQTFSIVEDIKAHRDNIRGLALASRDSRLFTCARSEARVWSLPSYIALSDVALVTDDDSYEDLGIDNRNGDVLLLDSQSLTRVYSSRQAIDSTADLDREDFTILSIVPEGAVELVLRRELERGRSDATIGKVDAFRSLGVREGDVVESISDQQITSPANIDSVMQAVLSDTDAPIVSIGVRRNNINLTYSFIEREVSRHSIEIEASVADVIAAFMAHLNVLGANESSAVGFNNSYYNAQGLVAGTGPDGLPLGVMAVSETVEDYSYFRTLGLVDGELITEIQGVPTRSFTELRNAESALVSELEAGQLDAFEMTVMRGPFLELNIRVNISNN